MAVERVRVKDVLELQRRPVIVEPGAEYTEIGVRSFGRGIFHKNPIDGASLGRKRVFAIESGDLVISNVFAWEGAVSVASLLEAGLIGSHRFMTFVPSDGRIDVQWAAWFFCSEVGLDLLKRASPGSAGRNRTLAIERFESLVIPLPPLDEQRTVAAKLDRIRALAWTTAEAQATAEQIGAAALEASVWKMFEQGIAAGWPMAQIGDVAHVNPSRDRLDDDQVVRFVPMAAVDAFTGTIDQAEFRRADEMRSSYKQFRKGDVIFARITPCMQNGKIAVFEEEGHAYGSTEFHVLRPSPDVHAHWIHRFLQTRRFRDFARARMTGTAGQQRVPAPVLRDALIPVPPLPVQADVVAHIDRLLSIGQRLHRRRAHAQALGAAVLPAAINEAFGHLR